MRIIRLVLVPLVFLMSCRVLSPQVMFKTPDDYPYSTDTSSLKLSDYIISPGDRIEMHFLYH